MQIAMIDERILAFEELDPVYNDRAIYFGDGVYEVIRSYKGKIFALEDHLRSRGLPLIFSSNRSPGATLRGFGFWILGWKPIEDDTFFAQEVCDLYRVRTRLYLTSKLMRIQKF